MIILINSQNRIIASSETVVTTDVHYILNDCGFMKNEYSIHTIDSVPIGATYFKNNKFSNRPFEEVEKDSLEIQKQLDDIDRKSVRDSEDILEALIKKGLLSLEEVPFVGTRVAQKKYLRDKLKEMG